MNQVANTTIDQATLELTFQDNLQFLQIHHPELYQKVCHYQPQYSFLGIDELGQINITCSNNWLYPSQHTLFFQKAINSFIEKQPCLKTSAWNNIPPAEDAPTLNEYIHRKISLIRPSTTTQKPQSNPYFPIILHYGIGLGLHLADLLNQCQSDYLILFEPHMDFFYASLFTCRYTTLLEKTQLILSICETPQQLITRLLNFKHNNQIHYLTKIGVLQHYTNDTLTQASHAIKEYYHRIIGQNGFLEDECISVSHTLSNLNIQPHFLKETVIQNKYTAIIVASGPSADHFMELIQHYQDKAIIFSCSSSLFLCDTHHITPDFNSECERNLVLNQFIERHSLDHICKKTHFLGLNVTPGQLTAKFKDATFALKGNDLGGAILKHYVKSNTLIHANPTSGNAALAFAVALGFQEIILIGFDCGYSHQHQHHAQDSIYFSHADLPVIQDQDLQIQSNNGDMISTSFILNQSKTSIELLIKDNPDITIYNTGNGAHIQGTTYITDITLEDRLKSKAHIHHKTNVTHHLISKRRSTIHHSMIQKIQMLSNTLFTKSIADIQSFIQNNIFATTNANSEHMIMQHMTQVQEQLSELIQCNTIHHYLFLGLKNNIAVATATQLHLHTTPEEQNQAYNDILTLCNHYLNHSIHIIQDYRTTPTDQIHFKHYFT